MHLIKRCPSCNKKLRFPIDKGKLQVRCSCGYKFIVDPDNPDLYRDAKFDLASEKKTHPQIKKSLQNFRQRILPGFIKRLIDYKYKLQNFRLLPVTEQRKIIAVLIIILLLIMLLLYFIFKEPAISVGGKNIVLR